jgi:segregation and condensation protein B
MSEERINEPENALRKSIESLLFIAPGPVTPEQLAEVLGKTPVEIVKGLKALEAYYHLESGLRVQWHAGKVQMTTAPELAGVIERFLGLETTARLSRAALETLTIIIYRQPITRPGVDAIRGVSSDGVLRSLLSKGLVEEVGRSEGPGRPILYGTTSELLQHFGLSSLRELPSFEPGEDEVITVEEKQLLKD